MRMKKRILCQGEAKTQKKTDENVRKTDSLLCKFTLREYANYEPAKILTDVQ